MVGSTRSGSGTRIGGEARAPATALTGCSIPEKVGLLDPRPPAKRLTCARSLSFNHANHASTCQIFMDHEAKKARDAERPNAPCRRRAGE